MFCFDNFTIFELIASQTVQKSTCRILIVYSLKIQLRIYAIDVIVYVIYMSLPWIDWKRSPHTMISISRTNANKNFFFLCYFIVTCSLTYGNKLCKFLLKFSRCIWLDGSVGCGSGLCIQKVFFFAYYCLCYSSQHNL